MGELEKEEASTYLEHCAIKRFGKVEEIAELFAACADEKIGYLTGADIVCDGGLVASGRNPLRN
jgi:NAD(P)-dependent dehydrogenase (short-subunit alcohol dehydrogenase family)